MDRYVSHRAWLHRETADTFILSREKCAGSSSGYDSAQLSLNLNRLGGLRGFGPADRDAT